MGEIGLLCVIIGYAIMIVGTIHGVWSMVYAAIPFLFASLGWLFGEEVSDKKDKQINEIYRKYNHWIFNYEKKVGKLNEEVSFLRKKYHDDIEAVK